MHGGSLLAARAVAGIVANAVRSSRAVVMSVVQPCPMCVVQHMTSHATLALSASQKLEVKVRQGPGELRVEAEQLSSAIHTRWRGRVSPARASDWPLPPKHSAAASMLPTPQQTPPTPFASRCTPPSPSPSLPFDHPDNHPHLSTTLRPPNTSSTHQHRQYA